MFRPTYHYIISLGCACNTSLYLKKMDLKKFSLPYDWIFSNLDMIEHTVKDEFKSFLNVDLIENIKPKRASHSLYHSLLFNHRNPKANKEDYEYYQRCIKRFEQILQSDYNKLFIHTMYNDFQYHQSYMKFGKQFEEVRFDVNKIRNFNHFLSTVTINYTLLVILQNPKQTVSQYTKIIEEENLLIYSLDCLGVSAGELLGNELDSNNYQQIINQFNFKLLPLNSEVFPKT